MVTPVIPPSEKPVVPAEPITPPAVPRRDAAVNPPSQRPPATPPLERDRRGRVSPLRLFVAELDAALATGNVAAVTEVVRKFKATSNELAAEVQRDKRELERRRVVTK